MILRDRRHQRIRIRPRVHEQPAAADLLLERVDTPSSPGPGRRSRRRYRRTTPTIRRGAVLTPMNFMTGSVHIRWRLSASWFGNIRCATLWLTIDDRLAAVAIAVVEVAAGDDRHAERGEESGRDRAEARARILFAVRLRRSPRP